jgi:hypothetical protein
MAQQRAQQFVDNLSMRLEGAKGKLMAQQQSNLDASVNAQEQEIDNQQPLQ